MAQMTRSQDPGLDTLGATGALCQASVGSIHPFEANSIPFQLSTHLKIRQEDGAASPASILLAPNRPADGQREHYQPSPRGPCSRRKGEP